MDFDVAVIGTGLAESIAAAALSKAGFKVAHVDNNQYYGGDEASLTLDELAQWADVRATSSGDKPPSEYLARQRARYTSITRSSTLPPQSRQYAVSLAPSIVPSLGPHIDSLIASGVSRYGSFKLLEKVAIYDRPGHVQSVPGSKEDVFKSKALSLVEKRRLMRFLMFAAGDFEGKKELEGKEQMSFLQYLRETFTLNDKPANAIAYALAFCVSPNDPTLPALQRIRQYLRSAGRYGASPFLVGHYGGLGETAQGFCRTSAVKGGTYILGRTVLGVKYPPPEANAMSNNEKASASSARSAYKVELEEFDEPLTARVVLSSSDYLSATSPNSATAESSTILSDTAYPVARCIAVVDKPLVFTPTDSADEATTAAPEESAGEPGENADQPSMPNYEVDTAVLVFPPNSLPNGSPTTAAHLLVTGEGSMSAPRGKYILNISLPLPSSTSNPSAEELLRPYLDAALTLTAPPSASSEVQPADPLFTVSYIHHPVSTSVPSDSADADSDIIITPPCTPLLPVIADVATQNAEAMFWRAVRRLKGTWEPEKRDCVDGEKDEATDKDGGEVDGIDSFWPPLDVADVESADDW
ncbi:FAD/NAD(P)-binding domain-containing protein [Cubamyces sp. BRFM 1775]|nr:FAD/NAD(P)-binding domain-containing protein [Cubamyces sp. BRFM 1775]